MAGKKLELLKEAVPRTTRIALLAPVDPDFSRQVTETQQAALALGMKLNVVEVRDGGYHRAFATIAADRPDALFVGANAQFFLDRKRVIELAAKHRLPAIYESRLFVDAGGLVSYGVSAPSMYYRAATFVDKILKGANPAELPMERPTKFELIINRKAVKALDLVVPPDLLLRSNEMV